jgi:4-amino-4-deoxy-L-arabinose transferase-like glycosyltransferase
MTLAALSFTLYLNKRKNKYLLLAGVFAGLSLLTKFPALFLLAFFPFAMVVSCVSENQIEKSWHGRLTRHAALRIFRDAGVVFLVTGVVFVVLWPAMWVEPARTIFEIVSSVQYVVREPHGSGFFMGVISNGTYPWYFYLVALLTRLTPVTLGLFVVCCLGVILAAFSRRFGGRQISTLLLIFYVILFVAQMTLGAKEGDRYVLPVFPVVDILAAVGLFELVDVLRLKMSHWNYRMGGMRRLLKTPLTLVILVAMILIQALSAVTVHPYYLAYYNPIAFGGPSHAADIMVIGWGEGMDQAAQYLNEKPNAENLTVAVQYIGFEPFFKGRTVGMNSISTADYVVFYVCKVQRGFDNDLWNQYKNAEPEKLIVINDITYCWIYRVQH